MNNTQYQQEKIELPLSAEENEFIDVFNSLICFDEKDKSDNSDLFAHLVQKLKRDTKSQKHHNDLMPGKYLSEYEMEFMNEIKQCLKEDGEITKKACCLLEKTRIFFRIPKRRAKEIMSLVLN